MKNTKKDTEKLRDDVDKQEVRVTQVEYIADDTADKVQEIDKKVNLYCSTFIIGFIDFSHCNTMYVKNQIFCLYL